jgi:hypothetical protein
MCRCSDKRNTISRSCLAAWRLLLAAQLDDRQPVALCVRAKVKTPLGAVTYSLNSRPLEREMKMLDNTDWLDIWLYAGLAIFLGGIALLSGLEEWHCPCG